jgi:hypothetical protein
LLAEFVRQDFRELIANFDRELANGAAGIPKSRQRFAKRAPLRGADWISRSSW